MVWDVARREKPSNEANSASGIEACSVLLRSGTVVGHGLRQAMSHAKLFRIVTMRDCAVAACIRPSTTAAVTAATLPPTLSSVFLVKALGGHCHLWFRSWTLVMRVASRTADELHSESAVSHLSRGQNPRRVSQTSGGIIEVGVSNSVAFDSYRKQCVSRRCAVSVESSCFGMC